MKRQLPLWSCLKASVAFVPRAYGAAPGALLLGAAPALAPLVVGDPAAAPAWAVAGVIVASVLTGLVRSGALYRLGVGGSPECARRLGLGPLGLQFGAGEVRLAAGGALVSLFLLLVAIAGFVVAVFIASAAGLGAVDWSTIDSTEKFIALAEPWKLALVAAVPLVLLVILAVLAAQLSLFAPATIGRGRVTSLDALALADGHFLKLIVGLAVVSLPTLLAAVARQALAPSAEAAGPWLMLEGLTAALIQAPLTAGFLSEVYRRLEYVPSPDLGEKTHG